MDPCRDIPRRFMGIDTEQTCKDTITYTIKPIDAVTRVANTRDVLTNAAYNAGNDRMKNPETTDQIRNAFLTGLEISPNTLITLFI